MFELEYEMNIWYLHHYATPYEIPGLHRPFEFGEYFNNQGNKTTVFTSSYLHYANSNMINDNSEYLTKEYNSVNAVFIKTCGYENSGSKRVINMFQFGMKLPKIAKEYAKKAGKPDIIIASSPHPFTMLAGLKIAKKFKIPCICEVRDFWPEVFF
ncbi:MAG: glycosyltransferase WbuB, partial [Clostridia bacterium]|nr:glycosyltransferase WbuB [Clostridia bacterium]